MGGRRRRGSGVGRGVGRRRADGEGETGGSCVDRSALEHSGRGDREVRIRRRHRQASEAVQEAVGKSLEIGWANRVLKKLNN